MNIDPQWVFENHKEAARLIESLQRERDELRKLAYIGDHMHEDYSWKARFAELKVERDALAAHVERCRDVFSGLSEYWNGCEGTAAENAAQNAMDVACDMLGELPVASLTRMKAQWQAKVLEELIQNTSQFREANPVRGFTWVVCNDELRRQAEGDGS